MTVEELRADYQKAYLDREKKIKELGVVEGVMQAIEYFITKLNEAEQAKLTQPEPAKVVDAEVVK